MLHVGSTASAYHGAEAVRVISAKPDGLGFIDEAGHDGADCGADKLEHVDCLPQPDAVQWEDPHGACYDSEDCRLRRVCARIRSGLHDFRGCSPPIELLQHVVPYGAHEAGAGSLGDDFDDFLKAFACVPSWVHSVLGPAFVLQWSPKAVAPSRGEVGNVSGVHQQAIVRFIPLDAELALYSEARLCQHPYAFSWREHPKAAADHVSGADGVDDGPQSFLYQVAHLDVCLGVHAVPYGKRLRE